MRYLLDTNVLSDFARGEPGVVSSLKREQPADLAISVITELEVEYGLSRISKMSAKSRETMRSLLDLIAVLPFEREDARVAGQLRASLADAGTPVGAYDLLLAATALRRGLSVVTHNTREFRQISGLNIEDWRST